MVIHTVEGFGVVSEADVDVFLELSCLFDDPTDVNNLISGSSAFSKSHCSLNYYADYIMQNAGLDESQAGIKIVKRNINNLRYTDDTTLRVESKEELKSLLMKVKEESEKVGLKFNIQTMKIMASGPITSW